jgi:DNA-directed RNA polymerase subunit RPC12/RpoP
MESERVRNLHQVPEVRLSVKERALPVEHTEQVNETVADKKVVRGQAVQCPRCGSHYMKRMKRSGFLEARVYWIFGYYPWRCTKCLGNFLLRKRGQSRRHRNAVAEAE